VTLSHMGAAPATCTVLRVHGSQPLPLNLRRHQYFALTVLG